MPYQLHAAPAFEFGCCLAHEKGIQNNKASILRRHACEKSVHRPRETCVCVCLCVRVCNATHAVKLFLCTCASVKQGGLRIVERKKERSERERMERKGKRLGMECRALPWQQEGVSDKRR